MTTRKRPLTAQIKPSTREAIMDQLALAADEIIRLRGKVAWYEDHAIVAAWSVGVAAAPYMQPCRWWHRFAWWRA